MLYEVITAPGLYNHPDDATLIFRNMLPSPGWKHAIQKVERPGDEAEVLGDYMPVCQYMSRTAFEELGDKPWVELEENLE